MAIRKGQERGAYFVLMTAGFVMLLAVAGLGFDLANIYYQRLLIQKAADAGIVAGLGYRVDAGPGATAADVNAKALQIARLNMLLIYDDTYLSNYVTFAVNYVPTGPGAADSISVTITNNKVGLFLLDKLPLGTSSLGFQQFTAQATGHLSAARVAMLLDLSGSMCCNAAGTGNCMATGGPGCAVAPNRKSDRLKDAAVTFLGKFKDGFDSISLVPYNITAKVTRSITSSYDKAAWTADVNGLANTPVSDTNPSDALIRAYQDAQPSGWLGTQDMSWVFFTDGARPPGASCPRRAGSDFQARPRIPSIWPAQVHRGPTITTSRTNGMTVSSHRTKGPPRLSGRIPVHAAADPRCTVPPWTTDFAPSDWMYLPYGFTHGNPRGFDGTTAPGMAPCSHHYSSNSVQPTLWHNLTDCFLDDGTDLGFTLRVPFDTNRQYGGNVPMTSERFAEQHYNATLAVADQARSQRGTFYVIGLGQRTPGMVTNGAAPDPYQDPNGEDYNRKDYFLTRLALDKDMCDLDLSTAVGGDLVDNTCNPGSITRHCCVDPTAGGTQYQQHFSVVQGQSTGLRHWGGGTDDYGLPYGSNGLPIGGASILTNQTMYDNRYRFGEYLPTSDANQLQELFQRIARRIQLRLIT